MFYYYGNYIFINCNHIIIISSSGGGGGSGGRGWL